jgi:hypothetical protein
MARKQRKPEPAAVYAIPLLDGRFAFGQVAAGLDMAFFDHAAPAEHAESLGVDEIIAKPVAFRVPIAMDAPSEGKWLLLGSAPLRGALAHAAKYKHKPVGAKQANLYSEGKSLPATDEGTAGLEVLATWFSMHIAQRLEDHFAGRPNAFKQAIEST